MPTAIAASMARTTGLPAVGGLPDREAALEPALGDVGGDEAAERHQRADRQVDAGGQDDEGHADGDEPRDRDLPQHVHQVERVQEVRLQRREDDDQRDEEERRGIARRDVDRVAAGARRRVRGQGHRGSGNGAAAASPRRPVIASAHLAEALGLVEVVLGDRERHRAGSPARAWCRRAGTRPAPASRRRSGRRASARSSRAARRRAPLASASGSASKPMIAMSSPCSCTTCSAPSAMSSLAATITSGGEFEAGEDRLGHRGAFLALEVRGLLGDDHVLVLHRVEHVVHALVAVDRRAGAGLALQVDDARAVGEALEDQVALRLAALDVVGADVGQDARRRRRRGGRW